MDLPSLAKGRSEGTMAIIRSDVAWVKVQLQQIAIVGADLPVWRPVGIGDSRRPLKSVTGETIAGEMEE